MNGKEYSFSQDIQAQAPQNMPFEGMSERESYDLLWNQEKQAQEEWNRNHFTGFRAGHYFRDGQRPLKK